MTAKQARYVLLTFRAYEEDAQWVSECEELGVASCGGTIQEALDSLGEATLLYLETLADEEGELERVFLERVFNERHVEIHAGTPPRDGQEVSLKARPYEVVSPHPVRIPAGAA
ncbi:MAG TPA: hypothetical protein VK821_02985 [Dehalococcoidia bacterium]|nr:hypothetical protein [Dehalococcoidia bacterium]